MRLENNLSLTSVVASLQVTSANFLPSLGYGKIRRGRPTSVRDFGKIQSASKPRTSRPAARGTEVVCASGQIVVTSLLR